MSRIAGIIVEYNPFHNGHAYHIKKTKQMTGCDFIIAVMSGDFVQRGGPALTDKYLRTKMALSCGADLVLELPVLYASQSAEYFAYGAVSLLEGLGCVDSLCFGSESGNTRDLIVLAEQMNSESQEYQDVLKSCLKQGFSFPLARKEALKQTLKGSYKEDILDSPNNILGIEYIRALLRLQSSIQPVTVKREGKGYHDKDSDSFLASASAIREQLLCKQVSIQDLLLRTMPEAAASLLLAYLQKEAPVWEDDFSLLLKYSLLLNTSESLTAFADMSPDLSRRIYKQLNHFTCCSAFTGSLKTKEITYTRISRALFHILLNIKKMDSAPPAAYARILGFQKEAGPLLKEIKQSTSIPLIAKAADYRKLLSLEGQKLFEQDLYASNLYQSVRAHKNGIPYIHALERSPIVL